MSVIPEFKMPPAILKIEDQQELSYFEKLKSMTEVRLKSDQYFEYMTALIHLEEASHMRFIDQFAQTGIKISHSEKDIFVMNNIVSHINS